MTPAQILIAQDLMRTPWEGDPPKWAPRGNVARAVDGIQWVGVRVNTTPYKGQWLPDLADPATGGVLIAHVRSATRRGMSLSSLSDGNWCTPSLPFTAYGTLGEIAALLIIKLAAEE